MKYLFAILILFSTLSARAESFLDKAFGDISSGAYIAPFVSQIVSGSITNTLAEQADSANDGEYKYEFSGIRWGLQVGYMLGRFVVGLEGALADFDYKFKHPSGDLLDESRFHTLLSGGFLMYRGERFVPWIGLYLDGYANDKKRDFELKSAGGLVFGFGYKLLDWLQLNIEYRSYSFYTYSSGGTEIELPTPEREEYHSSETLIGISIPFELGKPKK